MKAILLSRTGGPSVLEYVDVPTPEPKPGEVLVKADTIGVSRPELLVRSGAYKWMPPLPVIPGIEMTGTVYRHGAGVSAPDIGQKVYVSARELPQRAGCYAEYIAVPQRALRILPQQADLEAAACLSNYQVAYHLLHTAAQAAAGQTVLIDVAAGGLGSAAIQLAGLIGMTTIGLVGSDEKMQALKVFGAGHVVNYRTENVAARIAAITGGRGVDLVLNAAGGESLSQQTLMLAPLGLIVSYGHLQGPVPRSLLDMVDFGPAHHASPAIRFFTMHTFDEAPQYRTESMTYLIERLAAGDIRPLIHARLPLRDASRAHEMLEAREVIGKVLLKP